MEGEEQQIDGFPVHQPPEEQERDGRIRLRSRLGLSAGLPYGQVDAILHDPDDSLANAQWQRTPGARVCDQQESGAPLARHEPIQDRSAASSSRDDEALEKSAAPAKSGRIIETAVHGADHDRGTKPVHHRRLSRRDGHRLMNQIDAMLRDQPSRESSRFELAREASHEPH